jgi:hypothetical protein
MDVSARLAGAKLCLHATIVMFTATMIGGFGYEFAIVTGFPKEREGQWKVAHSGSSINAVFLFAVAAVQPLLTLSSSQRNTLVHSMIVAVYGNMIGYTLGALVGHRGLTPVCLKDEFPFLWCSEGLQSLSNVAVNVLFCAAIMGLLVSVYYLITGANKTLAAGQKRN